MSIINGIQTQVAQLGEQVDDLSARVAELSRDFNELRSQIQKSTTSSGGAAASSTASKSRSSNA